MKLKPYLPWLLAIIIPLAAILAQAKITLPRERAVQLKDARGSSCSGVILQTGEVLTAAHCVKSPLTLDGQPAVLLKVDVEDDLALLNARTMIVERTSLADVVAEEEVTSYGHPMGDSALWHSKGYVMNVANRIMVSNITLPGDSGAPVFNASGRLIGIVSGMQGANGFDFPVGVIIPASKIKSFMGW